MSRRRPRRREPAREETTPRGRPLGTFLRQAGLLALVFALVAAIAEIAGAANLGTALGFGQIAFVVALVVLLLRR